MSVEFTNLGERNRAIQNVVAFLQPTDKDEEPNYAIIESLGNAAAEILDIVDVDSAELTIGLRALIDAKDAFLRAATFLDETIVVHSNEA